MNSPNQTTTELSTDSIQQIANDLDRFFGQWIAEFRARTKRIACASADDQLREQIAEFEAYRDEWEAYRQREQENLEQVARQLSDAWMRLEDEQRAHLKAGASSVNLNANPDPVVDETPDDPTPHAAGRPAADIAVADGSDTSRMEKITPDITKRVNDRVAIPVDVIPRDVALKQFEELRNQIVATN